MTAYFTLLADDTIAVGDTIPNIDDEGRPHFVVSDPRAMPTTEALGDDRAEDGLVEIVQSANPTVRVVRVTPHGTVRPHCASWDDDDEINSTTVLEAERGWKVESIEPLHTILGPQGELVLVAVEQAIQQRLDDYESALYDAYVTEQNEVGADALHTAVSAAEDALNAVGADGYWWSKVAGCVWGTEIIALAARDLIGTEGWDQDGYNRLTRAWRRTLAHRLHPEDPALVGAAS
jgi:hypothetical protein